MMLKRFWYRYFRYPSLMTDAEDGIKSFTERRIADNLKTLRGKITSFNANPISEVEHNPEFDAIAIPDSIYRENKKKRTFLLAILILLGTAECYLNFISMLVVIPGGSSYPWLFFGLRSAIAGSLTIVSIVVLELLFESFFHDRIVELKAKYGIDFDSSFSKRYFAVLLLLSVSLLLVIWFVVEKRARATEQQGEAKDLAYYGLILLSVVIPIIGGVIAFERKRAKKIINAAIGKRQHINQIRQREEAKAGAKGKVAIGRVKLIADSCSKYWKQINDFKTVKASYDKKMKLKAEDLGRHKVHVDDFKTYQEHIEALLNGSY